MIIDIILIVIGLAALLFASIVDIKTREVPDWLTYSLIWCGLSLRLIHSLVFSDWKYFLYGLLGFAIMFVFGNLMYRTRQWGGGDAKLLMGLGAVFATQPFYMAVDVIPFLLTLFTNILIVGAVYGLIIGVAIAIKYKKQFKKAHNKLKELPKVKKQKLYVLIATVILLLVTNILISDVYLRMITNFLLVLVLIYPYVWLFVKAVEVGCMHKMLPVSKLTEGDWVEKDIKYGNKIIYKRKPYGIEKPDIVKLKKFKIKQVLVKEGIPFVPPFFLGTVLTLVIEKIIFLI